MNISIIGSGNMGGAIAKGLVESKVVKASDLYCTAQTEATLEKLKNFDPHLKTSFNNKEAVQDADIVFLAVKPWKIEAVINEIKPELDYSKQIVVSVASGVSESDLAHFLKKDEQPTLPPIFRVMPNTAIAIRESVTFVSSSNAKEEARKTIISLFNQLGKAFFIEESMMGAAVSLASCGIAYAFRYIRAAMEGGVEMGFYPKDAAEIVAMTVKGAADLLLVNKTHPEEEIDKVTTPGGITIKGLNCMEANGFTNAVIQGLKASK